MSRKMCLTRMCKVAKLAPDALLANIAKPWTQREVRGVNTLGGAPSSANSGFMSDLKKRLILRKNQVLPWVLIIPNPSKQRFFLPILCLSPGGNPKKFPERWSLRISFSQWSIEGHPHSTNTVVQVNDHEWDTRLAETPERTWVDLGTSWTIKRWNTQWREVSLQRLAWINRFQSLDSWSGEVD